MGTWTHTLQQETDGDESLLKRDDRSASVKLKEVVGCTHADCHCECFRPGRHQIRSCDRCGHGWVAHAVGKVCGPALVCSGQVEIAQSHVVFDVSSLILYGTQALPVRMKILLDRLFSVLTHTQVLNIIHTLGWTLRDYVRGYMLQDSMGKVLDRWVIMSPEDEVVTLRQFLRFGETKSIVELMSGEMETDPALGAVERSAVRHSPGETLQHFENLPGGSLAFLQPFHYISPSPFPPSPAPHPATQKLQQLSEQNQRETRPRDLLRSSTRPPNHDEHRLRPPVADSCGTRERRHGSSSSKGRVSCDACAKTFYDKGTLKIHFNAVHLKIKHRCTIAGCNMMFSSLRSRNRHSANPNPRLHAALQHAAHRLSAHPRRTPLSVSDRREDLPSVCEAHGLSGGGATGNRTANQNGLCDLTPKKKSRKSSTPLKLKREEHGADDDRITILPRQPANSLHGNKHHIFNAHTQYEHLGKTAYGYHSSLEERNDWMVGEIPSVDDEWKGRFPTLLKVKEELCDLTCDCRGHRRSNL